MTQLHTLTVKVTTPIREVDGPAPPDQIGRPQCEVLADEAAKLDPPPRKPAPELRARGLVHRLCNPFMPAKWRRP